MKTLTLLLLLAILPLRALTADALTELLQKGLMEEEAQRDLPAAMRTYRELIEKVDGQRRLAATAVFRLGETYRKLGQTNEAVQHYQRLIREFPGETELAKLSQQNLAALGMTAVPGPGTPTAKAVSLDDSEEKELQRLEILIRNSPDLLEASAYSTVPGISNSLLMDPLQHAAARGLLKVVDFLIQHHVNLTNGGSSDLSALHWAAWRGHRAVVQRLLEAGVPASLASSDGYTPLHLAAAGGRRQIVQQLLEAGANKNATLTAWNNRSSGWWTVNYLGKMTPLGVAIAHKATSVVPVLLESKVDLKQGWETGDSAIEVAVRYGTSDQVEQLISAGGDLSWTFKESLYQLIVDRALRRTEPATADLALIVGKLHSQGVKLSPDDATRLLVKLIDVRPAVDLVDAFVAIGAPVNATENNPPGLLIRTLRQLWSHEGSSDRTQYTSTITPIVKSLLKAKANVNEMDPLSNTCPLTQTPSSQREILMMLIEAGADPNLPHKLGRSLLHELCSMGDDYADVLEAFLKHGAELNQRNANGLTPLDVVRLSQRPDSRNPSEQRTFEATAAVLLRHGAKESRSLPDFNTIQVYRESTGFSAVLFRRGTNDWNSFTIHEALSLLYSQLNAPEMASPYPPPSSRRVTPRRMEPGTTPQPASIQAGLFNRRPPPPGLGRVPPFSNSSWPALDWPQLDSITIRRFQADGTSSVIKVVRKDEPLQWGDILEIPEATHPLNQQFPGISDEWWTFLAESVQRTVALSISGVSTNLTLRLHNRVQATTFSLSAALNQQAGLILSSSDMSRVKVVRPAKAGQAAKTWVIDLVNPIKEPTLWMRDGDSITIEDYKEADNSTPPPTQGTQK